MTDSNVIISLFYWFHTLIVLPILLYRHYSPDQLISRTRGPLTRSLSVHGDPNVNPKWNNMFATSWTSMHTASNRSTALPKLWQSIFLSPMWAGLQIPAMKSEDGKFCWVHRQGSNPCLQLSGLAFGASVLCRNWGMCPVGTRDLSYSETEECVIYTGTGECIIYIE